MFSPKYVRFDYGYERKCYFINNQRRRMYFVPHVIILILFD